MPGCRSRTSSSSASTSSSRPDVPAAAPRRRARAHARARGPHRGRALSAAVRPWSGLRHGAHACARRPEAGRTRSPRRRPPDRQAEGRRRGRRLQGRVPARHAQHAGLRRRSPSTRRSACSSTPATSRSIRRRSTASSSTSIVSPSSAAQGVLALFADSTNIDRKGFSGSETRRRRRVRGDLHEHAGHDRRRDVLVEHLPHAGGRRSRGAVRSARWRSSAAA